MWRANVEAVLADVGAAHRVMVKSQERLLTIGSLRYGRLVPHAALAQKWRLRPGSTRHFPQGP